MAGLLAQPYGPSAGLLADAVTFLVSTVALLAIRVPGPRPKRRVGGNNTVYRDIGEGLRFIVRDPYLRALTAFGGTANLALTGYQSIIVLFLIREVRAEPGMVGVLISLGALGGVLGAVLARPASRRWGTARGALVLQLVAAPFGLLMPLAAPGWRMVWYVVGSVAMVSGVVACNVIFASFRQAYSPPHLLSRVVATSMFINHGTIPIGAVVGGFLGSVIGLRPTMWMMMVILVLAGGILLASPLRRARQLPTSPAPQVMAVTGPTAAPA